MHFLATILAHLQAHTPPPTHRPTHPRPPPLPLQTKTTPKEPFCLLASNESLDLTPVTCYLQLLSHMPYSLSGQVTAGSFLTLFEECVCQSLEGLALSLPFPLFL